jgi:uncharacterized protein YecE (DUF72 family)
MPGRLRLGCSGWSYPHWRERVYHGAPQREWLPLYAQLFDSVEVNASFYRLPTVRAVTAWAEQTPDGFELAVKVSRYITHVRRLRDVAASRDLLLERLGPLIDAGKLGPLLWQLPESFHRDDERLASALREFPTQHRNAIEFRHPSWFCEPVMALLRDAGVALVIGDHPRRPFQAHVRTAEWMFVRFHHGSAGRRGNYSPRELATWARRVRRWLRGGDVHAYFNNDWEGFAVANARELGRLVQRSSATTSPRRRGKRRSDVSLAL